MAPVRRLVRGRRHRGQDDSSDQSANNSPRNNPTVPHIDANNNNTTNPTAAAIIAKGPKTQQPAPPPLSPPLYHHNQHSESSEESQDSDHWQPDTPNHHSRRQSRPSARSGRLTRGAAAGVPASSVTVSRSPPSLAEGSKKSIHLTVKMSSSKLRQVTNSRSSRGTASNRHNIFTDNPVVLGKRSSRNTRNLKEDSEDDDEIDEEEDEEIEDSEDATGEDDEELDADGDLDMEDVTPQPPVSKRSTRPAAAAAKAKNKAVKSVEEKEMELSRNDEEDDEDLSEPDSDAEGEVDDTMLQDEEMGDGIEEEEEGEEVDDDDDDDEEDDLGSDDDSSTPDLTKLTKRQRGSLGKDFLQLPMEPQVKKHLTAEEHAMRRAEMARRRKNLSEKRNEEEKMDTINRLLKKQAPKRRGRIPATETVGEATPDLPIDSEKPDPTMIRWVSGRDGCKAYVPDEILGTPSGRPFGGFSGGKLIEEV